MTGGCLERLGHVSCPDGVPRVEEEEVPLGCLVVALPAQVGRCQSPIQMRAPQLAFP